MAHQGRHHHISNGVRGEYNFSTGIVELANLGMVMDLVLGAMVVGYTSDR